MLNARVTSRYSALTLSRPLYEWEVHLQAAVGRARRVLESGLRAPQLVRADDEILVGVERSARANQVIDLVVVQREAVHEQDGVVLGGVELAVSDVGHPEILDDPAAFQPKLAQARDLVRSLIGPVGGCWWAVRQQRHRQCSAKPPGSMHRGFPSA